MLANRPSTAFAVVTPAVSSVPTPVQIQSALVPPVNNAPVPPMNVAPVPPMNVAPVPPANNAPDPVPVPPGPIVLPFDGCDPSIILEQLQSVDVVDCINGKKFWKTYGTKWENLSSEQRNKTVAFWNNNITGAKREEILSKVRDRIALEIGDDNIRQAITTKHDNARILHLRGDPAAIADWTAALREKTRQGLDAREDPWNRLAEKFNDYERYKYQNACIVPGITAGGAYVAVAGMERIASICHDINPSLPGRPMRDSGWLREHYKILKGKISVCFNNYHRSGNQDAENVYDEWVKFSTPFSNDIVTYSRCLFENDELDQLGRALPVEHQRDTGLTVEETPEEAAERRQRQSDARKRQRLEARNRGSTPALPSNVASPEALRRDFFAAFTQGVTQHVQIAGLTVIMQFGTPSERAVAQAALFRLTGLDSSNDNHDTE